LKETIPVVSAIIAGFFAVVCAVLAWKLRNATDERARLTALQKERRDELKRLFTDIYMLFEQAIGHALRKEEFALGPELSEVNARVRLLAPETIVAQYFKVAAMLENWSQLHYRATPRQMKIGEGTVSIIEAPDPTAKYKEPAKEAHEELQEQLNRLIDLMRTQLE